MVKGGGDFAVDFPLGRNVAYGRELKADGSVVASDAVGPVWGGIDLAMRYGLTDDVSLDTRLSSSFPLPIPFPLPNGATLAPVFAIFKNPEQGWSVFVSPRFLWINGTYFLAIPNASSETKIRTFGAELPLLMSFRATKSIDLSATAFFRTFYNFAKLTEKSDKDGSVVAKGNWSTYGGGLSTAAVFTLGGLRISLGLGFELIPNPKAGESKSAGGGTEGAVLAIPQGGLSFGTAF